MKNLLDSFFSPDSSENPFFEKGYFLLKKKSGQRKLFFLFAKKAVLKKDCNE
jgi:hypothetical protein